MSIATRSQKNAQAVYTQISQVDDERQADYKIWCHKFPILILRNGLSQATGFLLAKSGSDNNNASGLLLHHVAELMGKRDAEELHQQVIRASLPEYQRLTRQILQAAIWYQRYSQSLFEEKDKKEEKAKKELEDKKEVDHG